MRFDRYFNQGELEAELNRLQALAPALTRLTTIGKSHEGRPIYVMTVSDPSSGDVDAKPAIWCDANMHATELAGTTVVLAIIDHLLNAYASGDQRVRELIARNTFYFCPRISPDGAELALSKKPELLRSGTKYYPWAEPMDGLRLEDIDGDGRILTMRLEDPSGDWKISSLDSRLMEKRAPDENGGKYFRLHIEGRVHGYDGHRIPGPSVDRALDFNRNFPYHWRSEGEQKGSGKFPTSEPEVRAVVEFVSSHPNINIALDFHTFSGILLRPYGDQSDDVFEARDLWVYESLSDRGTEITGYPNGPGAVILKYHPKEVITGVCEEWLFDQFGIFSWTVEIWDIIKRAGIERKSANYMDWFRRHPHLDDVRILEWYLKNVPGGKGYVDWYPFDHPELGRVELGGWDMLFTWRNPPHNFMGAEAELHIKWFKALCETLPRLEIHLFEAKPLGDSRYLVTLVVDNLGFLPSFTSEQAKKRKAVRPVRAEIQEQPGLKILSPKQLQELGHLEGRSHLLDQTIFDTATATSNRGKVEWVVQAPPGTTIKVKVMSDRAGSIEAQCAAGARA